MKKFTVAFCALILLTLFNNNVAKAAPADTISLAQAQDIAAYYHAIAMGQSSYKADHAVLVQRVVNPVQGAPIAYYFNIANGGWVIVSGTTVTHPIIAFCEDGELDPSNYAPSMKNWMDGFCGMLIDAQDQQIEMTDELAKEWYEVLNHGLYPVAQSKATNWLIDTKWGQGESYNPTFNIYSPVLWGSYCPVGCVSTALSQIMKYYEYPVVGSGMKAYREKYTRDDDPNHVYQKSPVTIHFDTVYDYANMPNQLYANSDSVQIKATALLCFYVGVSVNMDYDVDGSGALSQDVPGAMYGRFKYKRGNLVYRSQYSSENWMDTLRGSLQAKRPLYYAASSSTGSGGDAAGHAFLCHGNYPTQPNLFRINWGWYGSSDGWFDMSTVEGLVVRSYGYNFSIRQEAIFGLEPPDDSNRFVGIQMVEMNADVLPAYPNPAFNTVTIPYTLQGVALSSLQIFDITGKLVEEVRVNSGSNKITINVSNYPQGIYIYRLKGGTSKKFIVQ